VFLGVSATVYFALRKQWSPVKRLFFLSLPVLALGGIVASSARASQLAAIAVAVWFLLKSPHRVRGTLLAVMAGLAVYSVLPEEQLGRFSTMGEDPTSQRRLTYWHDGLEIMRQHPVLGVGYKNWIPYYRTFYDPEGQVPHNIFIEAGAELGYTGLGAFVFLIGVNLLVNARTRRMTRGKTDASARLSFWLSHGFDAALVGYLVNGFFVTVLYYPFFWINLTMSVALSEVTRRCHGAARLSGQDDPESKRPVSAFPGPTADG